MRKLTHLFARVGGQYIPEVEPGNEWALIRPTRVTVKWDGTCCAVFNGQLFARRQVKTSKLRAREQRFNSTPLGAILSESPAGFRPFYIGSSRIYGWIPVTDDPNCRKHRQFLQEQSLSLTDPLPPGHYPDGTYELIGPGVNGNNHGLEKLELRKHGLDCLDFSIDYGYEPVDEVFRRFKRFFEKTPREGVVIWSVNHLACKVRSDGFGIKWPR